MKVFDRTISSIVVAAAQYTNCSGNLVQTMSEGTYKCVPIATTENLNRRHRNDTKS